VRQDIEPIKARHDALAAKLRANAGLLDVGWWRTCFAAANADRATLLGAVETERRINRMLNDDLNVERQRSEGWRSKAVTDASRADSAERRARELASAVEDLEQRLGDRFRVCPDCKAAKLPPTEYLYPLDAPGETDEEGVWRCAPCASVQRCCGCPSAGESQIVEGYSSYPAVGPSESPCSCDCHPVPDPEW
jgi:uncharacterized protein with PIN domain